MAGGTKGAFVRADATHATLVVAPPVDSTGTINVSVAAGTFSDAVGNANTASAAAQQAYDTVVSSPPSRGVITFDETAPPMLTGFEGADSTIVTDPTSAAYKVARVVKSVDAQPWAGTTVSTLPNTAVETIPFSSTKTFVESSSVVPGCGNPGAAEGGERR